MPSDYWTGPIVCVHCGTSYRELNIATRITGDPMVRYMRVGAHVEITHDDIPLKYYLPLHSALGGDELRVLEAWLCEPCGQYCWTEVVVRGGVFAEFRAVRLAPEVLDGANLIAADELQAVFPTWTGLALYPGDDWQKPPRPDWIALARDYLGEHPQ